jgi:hypothetical protein
MLYLNRHQLYDQNWLILALIYMSGTMTRNVFFWKLNAHLLDVKNHVAYIGDCSTRVQSEDNKLHLLQYNCALPSNLPLWCADRSCVMCVCVCVCVLEHIKIPCRNVRYICYDLPSYFRIHTSLTTFRLYWTVGISSFQISSDHVRNIIQMAGRWF